MTIIKKETKKGRSLLYTANNYEGTSLRDIYGRYSNAKAAAMRWCRELCVSENGTNFHICSHNTSVFTVAWETPEGVRVETRDHSYLIK